MRFFWVSLFFVSVFCHSIEVAIVRDVIIENFPTLEVITPEGKKITGIIDGIAGFAHSDHKAHIANVLKGSYVRVSTVGGNNRLLFISQTLVRGVDKIWDYQGIINWGDWYLNLYLIQKGWVLPGDAKLPSPKDYLDFHSTLIKWQDRIQENIKVLEDPARGDKEHATAIKELKALGYHARAAVPGLLKLLDNPRWRGQSTEALGFVNSDHHLIVPALINHIDKEPLTVLVALSRIGEKARPAELTIVEFLLRHADEPRKYEAAMLALKSIGNLSSGSLDILNAASQDHTKRADFRSELKTLLEEFKVLGKPAPLY